MINKALNRLAFIALITVSNQSSVFAEEVLSRAELDVIVKEDIASAQVLTEICPSIIGNKTELNKNIEKFTQLNLKRLSNPATTLTALQQDSEYQAAYKDAKKATTEIDDAERKSECENVLTLGDEIDLG